MRPLLLCLCLLACDDEPGAEALDASTPPADADAGPPGPLALRFVELSHETGARYLTDLAFLPDDSGELLAVDKDGLVLHLRVEGDAVVELLSFRIEETWNDSDAGLISVALDPRFVENGWLYLGLSISKETNEIRRYTLVRGDAEATAASAVEVLSVTGERAPRSWHNIGSIGFDDDGVLWALFGDKVLGAPAQDRASPLGALLRLRPLPGGGYDAPDDNPYADGSGHPLVYAKGFRSPWKGAYADGRWFVGDVGQDMVEELNQVSAPGQSFGWPTFEGPCDPCDGEEPPWTSFGRDAHPFVLDDPDATGAKLRSIWVGTVRPGGGPDPYRGAWDGVLTFGEVYTGFVRGVRIDDPDAESWHVGHLRYGTAMAKGPGGYVYVTALGNLPADEMVVPARILRAEPP